MPEFTLRRTPALLGVLLALGVFAGLLTLLRTPSSPSQPPNRSALIDSGRAVFRTCALCHGPKGQGDRCPPLVYSDFVQGDPGRLIRFVLRPGDSVRVNGVLWHMREMPALETLSDFKVAAVLTYLRSLNDSLITCTAESVEAGTWAECRKGPRSNTEMRRDSISPAQVAAARVELTAGRGPQP